MLHRKTEEGKPEHEDEREEQGPGAKPRGLRCRLRCRDPGQDHRACALFEEPVSRTAVTGLDATHATLVHS